MSSVDQNRDGVCFFCEAAWAGIRETLDFSKRDAEILQCLILGDDERNAAIFLRLSHCTVHTHLKRIHEKLGVHSRTELVVQIFYAHNAWLRASTPPPGCHLNR